MNSKIKKVIIASVLTLGLIGATFVPAPTASACGLVNDLIHTCQP